MRAIITPGAISGQVTAPSSKSMTQRAYAAALLHKGKTIIRNAGNSNDEVAALNAIRSLGAAISEQEHAITVTSGGIQPSTDIISVHESGLAARLFIPIASLSAHRLTITGSGSLPGRSMAGVREILEALQVTVTDFEDHLPITLQGPAIAGNISVEASGGSQLLSGLLMATSYAATRSVTLTVHNLASKPYIDLTLQVLQHFGRPVRHNNYQEFYIDPATFTDMADITINIEGDWSGAANLLAAGAVAGNINVSNLDIGSKQADRAIYDVLKHTGADIQVNGNNITTLKSQLSRFTFDATHSPDLFPILAIIAAHCNGNSSIKGLHRLYNKESDRVASTTAMLHNFGVPFSIDDDTLYISGVPQLKSAAIDGYNDHRIVMAAAVGALTAAGPVTITDATAVNKSYPAFFKHLSLCGANCTLSL